MVANHVPSGTVRRLGRTGVMLIVLLTLLVPAYSGRAMGTSAEESTLIEEEAGGSAVYAPRTDGEYVAWTSSSVSASAGCSYVNVAYLDDRSEVAFVSMSRSGGSWAIDDGYLFMETPRAFCVPGSLSSEIESGMFLIELASGETRTILEEPGSVDRVAIDYPYIAWTTIETINEDEHLTVWAMELMADSQPTEVATEVVPSDVPVHLFIEEDTLYWITTPPAESTEIGSAARAPIGGPVTHFMSLHDTTDVALAGDLMVTRTQGRPLLHHLATGEEVWLADDEVHNLATDGRYVFWSPGPHSSEAIIGYDTLTSTRFEAWAFEVDPESLPGSIRNVSAKHGVVVWDHYGYDYDHTGIHASLIRDRLPSAYQPDPGTTSPDSTYYPESGHYLANDFRDYWTNNGGLSVFGYPLTEEFDYLSPETGNAHPAQMTERQRFEWHPENAGTPYAVLLGRLGETILQQQGRDWTIFEQADPSSEHYFPETGHAIAPEFWDYWSTHGLEFGDPGVSYAESLALFGYPLSGPMIETNADGDTVLTQYFERAVFEHHPDNPPASQVLLRRLGAEVLASWDW